MPVLVLCSPPHSPLPHLPSMLKTSAAKHLSTPMHDPQLTRKGCHISALAVNQGLLWVVSSTAEPWPATYESLRTIYTRICPTHSKYLLAAILLPSGSFGAS